MLQLWSPPSRGFLKINVDSHLLDDGMLGFRIHLSTEGWEHIAVATKEGITRVCHQFLANYHRVSLRSVRKRVTTHRVAHEIAKWAGST